MIKGNYHKQYNVFYASKEWQYLRDTVRARDCVCQECLSKGVITQGTEVHHIVPIAKDFSKRFDEKNCILLCRNCHDAHHPKRLSKLGKFFRGVKK